MPAAGRGSRLGALTADRPKGLVPVAGEPLLAHVFRALIDTGVEELVVVIGYRGEAIVERFGDAVDGVPITYAHQRERRGLGHAVSLAEPHVDGPFLVLNGDNVLRGTPDRPVEAFRTVRERDNEGSANGGSGGGDATNPVPVDAVLAVERADLETARETGVVSVEGAESGGSDRSGPPTEWPATGVAVTDVVEKPENPSTTLVTTGCYVLDPVAFRALALVEPSARGEIELADAVRLLLRAGRGVRAVGLGTERVNVNRPPDLERAATLLEA